MPDFIKAIGAARFGVMAGVAAALTAFFLYVAGVISTPPKAILFSGLEPKDAAAVVAKLDAMAVAYDAKEDGGTIMVPAEQVTKLRMTLAQDNLPAAGVGYEIFDKSDAFGTTAFVQNINRLRALEGELARSIQTIEGVESVRVHLVVPERQIFSRDQQAPSGSVVLKTRGTFNRGQVSAIQHLVAAAVSSMSPERVAIVDDKGNLLAGGQERTGDDATSNEQEQHTTDFEDRMRQRIESVVASVVGAGHVRAQVTANLDYTHMNETSETFDPDSKVVRSTQTVERNASDTNGNGAAPMSVGNALPGQQQQQNADNSKSSSGSTEETTNYEISKTVKTSTVDQGTVKKISVAVVIDGGDKDGKYVARTAQEMKQIDALVKSSIGFDAARGDLVQVVNMPFARVDATVGTAAPQPLLGLDGSAWFKIIEAAIFGLASILIGLFVLRPLIARMFAPVPMAITLPGGQIATATAVAGQLAAPGAQASASQPAALPAGEGMPALAAPRESMIDISRIEGQVRESSVKKVGEVVQSHPEEALAILRSWLHQPV